MLSHFSRVWLFVTPLIVASQAPLSTGFSRQRSWNGLPFSPPGDLPDPGIKPTSLMSPALAGGLFTTHTTGEALRTSLNITSLVMKFLPTSTAFLEKWWQKNSVCPGLGFCLQRYNRNILDFALNHPRFWGLYAHLNSRACSGHACHEQGPSWPSCFRRPLRALDPRHSVSQPCMAVSTGTPRKVGPGPCACLQQGTDCFGLYLFTSIPHADAQHMHARGSTETWFIWMDGLILEIKNDLKIRYLNLLALRQLTPYN